MKCPRCQSIEMEVRVRGEETESIEIDVCPECSGTWLDKKELTRLDDNFFIDMEQIEYEKSDATEDDAAINCPRCESTPELLKCHPKVYDKVVVDNCPDCGGFWLDKGELEKMRDVSDRALIASLLDD